MSITAPWPVPNYAAWRQRHIGVRNMPMATTASPKDKDKDTLKYCA